jgi:selT/selW/selH-like putative selenoprotein
MHFRILYCKPCGYENRAADLATELRDRFGGTVAVEEGKFGQFDVEMDGEIVASKGRTFLRRMLTHGAPPQDRILAAIEQHLAAREGDACEIPVASTRRPPGDRDAST